MRIVEGSFFDSLPYGAQELGDGVFIQVSRHRPRLVTFGEHGSTLGLDLVGGLGHICLAAVGGTLRVASGVFCFLTQAVEALHLLGALIIVGRKLVETDTACSDFGRGIIVADGGAIGELVRVAWYKGCVFRFWG